MPETFFRFTTGAVTHQGRVRDHNEDRFLTEPGTGIWVVADGMGGHQGGELASGAIVDHLGSVGLAASAPDLQARFLDRLARANDSIQDLSAQRGGAIIGSTVVAILVYEKDFACIWSGDSRAYLLRDGVLRQVSRDHTEVQELLDRGMITPEEARDWPRRNVITRAIGASAELMYEVTAERLRDNDVFVLCSDGLTGHVEDEEIREAVASAPPQAACDRLLQMTLDRGASDNVTVVVVRCAIKTLVVSSGAGPESDSADAWT